MLSKNKRYFRYQYDVDKQSGSVCISHPVNSPGKDDPIMKGPDISQEKSLTSFGFAASCQEHLLISSHLSASISGPLDLSVVHISIGSDVAFLMNAGGCQPG
jgi:hypothetical protein